MQFQVETLDADYTALQSSVPFLHDFPLVHLNDGLLGMSRQDEASIVRAHIMQLTEGQRKGLYRKYKNDFLLFDYHPDRY